MARFSLSYSDIEEFVACWGGFITYEAIRQRTLKFGQAQAHALRLRQPKDGDKWYPDEVMLTIKGRHMTCDALWTRTANARRARA